MNKLLALAGLACLVNVASAASPYIGASVGYLFDSKKAYPTARVGIQFAGSPAFSHNIELEAGHFSDGDDYGSLKFTPLMVNYRGEFKLAKHLSGYVGAGAGASLVDIEAQVISFNVAAIGYVSIGLQLSDYRTYTISEHSTVFTAQGLAGLSYDISDRFSVLLGGRYLWLEDAKFLGMTYPLGDDEAAEFGLRVKF